MTRLTVSPHLAGLVFLATAIFSAPAIAGEPESYHELRVNIGAGGSWSATPEGDGEGFSGESLVSLGGSYTHRDDWRLVGATVGFSETLFSESHLYVGGLFGAATTGRHAHVALLGEVGAHHLYDIGDGLFTSVRGETSATMPYVGATFRLSFEPRSWRGVVVDVSVRGRHDLTSTNRVVTESECLFGCSDPETVVYDVGGPLVNATIGVGWRF